MKTRKIIVASASILIGTTALAHQGATGIVRERMDLMLDIGAQMKTVSQMLRGQVTYDADAAQAAMMQIQTHASVLPDMFPKGSGAMLSEASPAIWEDPTGFNAIFTELASAANAAAAAASDPAELAVAFGRVAKTCTSCHEGYRIAR